MAQIIITMDDSAAAELDAFFAQQAASVRVQNGGRLPIGVPESLQDWISSMLERNLGSILIDRRKTPDVEQAKAAKEEAERALFRTASGIKSIQVVVGPPQAGGRDRTGIG